MTPKSKLWMGIAAVVIILVLAWLAFSHSSKPQSGNPAQNPKATSTQPSAIVPLKVTRTDVPPAQAPTGFPTDIPIEKNAQIIQNYNATANGLIQATRTFITKQTLADNFTLYSNYLKNSGRTVTNSLDLSTDKGLAATRNNSNLQITISQNTITKVNTVDISYVGKQ